MYTKFTHAIAGLLAVLTGFYAVSVSFRDWVAALAALYAAHVPSILQPIPALALALYMWYRNGEADPNQPKSGPPPVVTSAMTIILVFALIFGVAGCSQLDTVIFDLPVATDIALSAVNIYEVVEGAPQPAVEAQIKKYSGELATDLHLLQAVLLDIKANGNATAYQKADAVLAAAQGHLSDLLKASHVTNPRTQAAIGAVINLVQAILDNVVKLLPQQNAHLAPFAATVASQAKQTAAPALKAGTAAKHFNQSMKELGINVRVHVP